MSLLSFGYDICRLAEILINIFYVDEYANPNIFV